METISLLDTINYLLCFMFREYWAESLFTILIVNFIHGLFWAILRLCNFGLIRFFWYAGGYFLDTGNEEFKFKLMIESQEYRRTLAFLCFLFGIPVSIVFLAVLLTTLTIAGLIILWGMIVLFFLGIYGIFKLFCTIGRSLFLDVRLLNLTFA